jgi:hypothetical protein
MAGVGDGQMVRNLSVWQGTILSRSDHFWFGSVFTFKKQPNRKAKKRKIGTQTEPEPVRTDRFGFGFLGPKPEKPMVIFLAS